MADLTPERQALAPEQQALAPERQALAPEHQQLLLLVVLGLAQLLAYLAARGLVDLRQQTIGFEVAYTAAFVLYLAAVALVLRWGPQPANTRLALAVIVLFALLPRLILLPTRPTLSDDMYRYVWDGRVQAHGLNPYRYAPSASEVSELRLGDHTVWRYINRKDAVTVYPPGAQLAFAAVWRMVGDSVTGYKSVFVLAELAGAALLLGLLRSLGQPLVRSLLYLWSPLLVFEVAHAGHVDGLMLPLLILAFWARLKERPWLLGAALGAATLVKLFPALLLPALLPLAAHGAWQVRLRPAAQMLAAMAVTLFMGYLPYLLQTGPAIGYLPQYFFENFNMGLAKALFEVAPYLGWSGANLANAVTFGGLAVWGGLFVLRPAADGLTALRRCVWLIAWFTLFTQNLFPWYLLWLLPLLNGLGGAGPLAGLQADCPVRLAAVQRDRWLGLYILCALAGGALGASAGVCAAVCAAAGGGCARSARPSCADTPVAEVSASARPPASNPDAVSPVTRTDTPC